MREDLREADEGKGESTATSATTKRQRTADVAKEKKKLDKQTIAVQK